MGSLWDLIVLNPMLNSLVALSGVLYGNFGLAIIVLTIVVRLATYPLTVRQLRSTRAMQTLQPKMQEIQKKYGRDKAKVQQETMTLYKEAGISPLGCMWPMLVQFPIWIALYQSITKGLAATPEDLVTLSQNLYSWPMVIQAVPLGDMFLGLNMAQPNTILAMLVAASMWVQQKMVTAPTTDPKQASMNNTMTMMMPLMFGVFSLSFPSGLAMYWVVSNLIGIITQYFIGGWGYLRIGQANAVVIPPKKTGFYDAGKK